MSKEQLTKERLWAMQTSSGICDECKDFMPRYDFKNKKLCLTCVLSLDEGSSEELVWIYGVNEK